MFKRNLHAPCPQLSHVSVVITFLPYDDAECQEDMRESILERRKSAAWNIETDVT